MFCLFVCFMPENEVWPKCCNKLNNVLKTAEWCRFAVCSGFNVFKVPADATVAVNSSPVATAHHLIDYAAVGGQGEIKCGSYPLQISLRSRKHVSKALGAHSHSISQIMARSQTRSAISLTNYPNKCRARCLNHHSAPPEYSKTLASGDSFEAALPQTIVLHICEQKGLCNAPRQKKRLTWMRWLYTKRVFIPGFSLLLKSADGVVQFAQVVFQNI